MRSRRFPCLFVRALACVLPAGCADRRAPATPELRVFAAASLTDAVRQAADAFEQSHHVSILINAAASGTLRRQIETGAPCDVFLSADPAHVDALESAGRIDPATRVTVAGNALVIVARGEHRAHWTAPDRLADPAVERIAIGNPDYVPAGRYARQALQHRGLWDAVAPKAAFADNAREALQHVAIGGVAFGVVYRSDASAAESCSVVYEFDPADHEPICYVAAAVRRPGANADAAAAFCRFLASDQAAAIWRAHGFGAAPR